MTARPLSDAERARLRAHMAAEQAQVQQQLAGLERTFDELVAAADLEPPDDEHDPEGTTAYERAQVVSLATAARGRLDGLERALTAVEASGFGACAGCGGSIGIERLLALPEAVRCVDCSARGRIGSSSTAP